MDKTRIIFLVLFVLVLLVGGAAVFKFAGDNQVLKTQNDELTSEKARLIKEKDYWQAKYAEANDKVKGIENELAKTRQAMGQLDALKKERDSYKNRYETISKDKEALVEEIKKSKAGMSMAVKEPPAASGAGAAPEGGQGEPEKKSEESKISGEDYWADVVRTKAELEAKFDSITRELLDTKNQIVGLERTNQELTLKIDDLNKEKTRLEQDLQYKERSMDIMSRDLVNERETRKVASDELTKMREDNLNLKRELIMANKERTQLQNAIKDIQDKKDNLDKRITEVENVFKQKTLALGELQEDLKSAIRTKDSGVGSGSASVELPPIVVKPEISGGKGAKGSIIAVNQEEKFIVMDIGESAGLKPGMSMKVMRGDKAIADVEIIETRKEISAADVRNVISGSTVQEGDTVVSK